MTSKARLERLHQALNKRHKAERGSLVEVVIYGTTDTGEQVQLEHWQAGTRVYIPDNGRQNYESKTTA